ncbi:MAG: PQQ-binding-like beta-propeller repeat protein [bacterium]
MFGSLSTNVITDPDGFYKVILNKPGTYRLTASKCPYQPSTIFCDVPPNIKNADIFLRFVEIGIYPLSIEINLAQNERGTRAITLSNTGSADMSFKIASTMNEVRQTKSSDITLISKEPISVESSRVNGTMSYKASYIYSGPVDTRILLYADDYQVTPGFTYPDLGLKNLGYSYTGFYSDPEGFYLSLKKQNWDLVIISHCWNPRLGKYWDDIKDYLEKGGRCIIETYDIDGSEGTSTLWESLGIIWKKDIGSQLNVYKWKEKPLFKNVPDFTSWDIKYFGDKGDFISSGEGIACAGFCSTYSTNEAGVVISNKRKAIVNSFTISENRSDLDFDGKLDGIELFENEIQFLLEDKFDLVNIEPGEGVISEDCKKEITLSFSGRDLMPGTYSLTLVIHSNDPDDNPLFIPITLRIKPSFFPLISIFPENGPVSSLITIKGMGFGENEEIKIDFGCSFSITKSDEKREFIFKSEFPSCNIGKNIITCSGISSHLSATISFNVIPTIYKVMVKPKNSLDMVVKERTIFSRKKIVNLGNVKDSFDLSCLNKNEGWNIEFFPYDNCLPGTSPISSTEDISPGESIFILVKVTPPLDAKELASNTSIIKISSRKNKETYCLSTITTMVGIWWTFHQDFARTGNSPDKTIYPPLGIKWIYKVKPWIITWPEPEELKGIRCSPAIYNGKIYFTALNGYLHCVDLKTGNLVWDFLSPGGGRGTTYSSPTVFDGVVYYDDCNGFHAVDAETGKHIWSNRPPSPPESYLPVVINGIVYIPGTNGLIGLDAKDGSPMGYRESFYPNNMSYYNGALFCEAARHFSGKVFSLDEDTGFIRWSKETKGGHIAPCVENGVVYSITNIGPGPSPIQAWDVRDGRLIWTFESGITFLHESPVIAEGKLYCASNIWAGVGVYCLDAYTGKLIWFEVIDAPFITSSPMIANGVLYVACEDGCVYGFDAEKGEVIWKIQLGSYIAQASPVVSDGVLYIGDCDGKLYALTPYPKIDTTLPKIGLNNASITLTITGSNFFDGCSLKLIRENREIDGQIIEKSLKKLVVSFDIRGEKEGVFDLVIKNPDGFSDRLDKAFTVIKNPLQILPSIEEGCVGNEIILRGAGFSLNKKINIDFGTHSSITHCFSDNYGRFEAVFRVDNQTFGTKTITASDSIQRETAIFFLKPDMLISPKSGIIGSIITIKGNGFTKEEKINIDFGTHKSIASAIPDKDGCFIASFPISNQAYGTNTITVKGSLSSFPIYSPFFITTRILVYPSYGKVGEFLTLYGEGFGSKSSVLISFGTNLNITSAITSEYGSFSLILTVDSQPYGKKDITARETNTRSASTSFFIPKETCYIKGYVLDSQGIGMEGVKVTLSFDWYKAEFWTKPDGYYEFLNLSGGKRYTISPYLKFWGFKPQIREYLPLLDNLDKENFIGTLAPTILLSTDEGCIGDYLVVEGIDFNLDEKIRIDFGTYQTIATSRVVEEGKFSVGFYIATQPLGYVSITAYGLISNKMAATTFSLKKGRFYIRGYLRDRKGEGISNIRVWLFGYEDKLYFTESNGYYEFLNLMGEKYYRISVWGENIWKFNPSGVRYDSLDSNKEQDFVGDGPSVALVPSAGPVGYVVTVFGEGFSTQEKVRIDFGDTPFIATATTSQNGSFTITFIVNSQSPGEKNVLAWGLSSWVRRNIKFNLLSCLTYGVSISKDRASLSGFEAERVYYLATLINTGNLPDSFILSSDSPMVEFLDEINGIPGTRAIISTPLLLSGSSSSLFFSFFVSSLSTTAKIIARSTNNLDCLGSGTYTISPMACHFFRYDAQHRGRCNYPVSYLNLRWKYKEKFERGYCSPVIGNNGIIYIAGSNSLLALNPNGILKWACPISRSLSSPAITPEGDIIYIGGEKGLYSFNNDGLLRWVYEFGSATFVNSSCVIDGEGSVYIGSNLGLFSINPDGSLKWLYPTSSEIISSPAIGLDGTLYFGCDDNGLYSISKDGRKKWVYFTKGRISSSPAIGMDGRLYFGSDDGKLYCISSDGNLIWKFCGDSAVNTSPSIGMDGRLYFGSDDGIFYCLDKDGNLLWNYPTGDRIASSPVIDSNGYIYFGSDDFRLYCLSSNGKLIKSYILDGKPFSSPVISPDGFLYIVGENDGLYAMGFLTSPNIILKKACDREKVFSGGTMTYTITYKNEGQAPATDVTIVEVLPERAILESEVKSQESEVSYWYDTKWNVDFDQRATKLRWIIPQVLPNEEGSLSFVVKIR